MHHPISIQRALKIFSVLGFIVLAGCATNPKASLPAVEQHVAERTNLRIAWPQSESEKAETDRAVQELLGPDLTPDTAVQIAVLNNRALRAVFEEIGLSQADLIAASRFRNPSFSASVRWPDHKPRGPNVEFSLVADLLDDLLIPIRKKIAREHLGQTERRVADAVLALAAEVKTATYTAMARQQFRARLAAIAGVNEAAADLAQRQSDAGNINQLELANQQVAAQQATLELARTDAQLRADREVLNRLLGLSSGQTNWKISTELPELTENEAPLDDLEEVAVHQRLDLVAAKMQIALVESALNLKRKTRLMPASVNLGLDTERDPDGGRLTGPRIEIGLPIFDQGQADLARLSAEWRRAVANYEGLATEIRSEVRAARDLLLAARGAADYYAKTLLPQRRLILRETLLHYNAMQKSNYELLAAKERQLVAERESIEALRDYWIARVQLERAAGGQLAGGAEPAAAKPAAMEETAPEHAHHARK